MQTIVEYGLANAVAATVLALVVFAVGCFVRSPALRHGLWLLVFVRLVLPPVWQVPISWPSSPTPEVAVIEREEFDSPLALLEAEESEWTPPLEEEFVADGNELIPSPLDGVVSETVAEPVEASAEPLAAPAVVERLSIASYLPMIGLTLWGAGTLWILGRAFVRIRRFQRMLKNGKPATEEMQGETATWAAQMGLRKGPQIWLVPGKVWPSLWLANPFGQSRVILPEGLLTLLNEEQKRAVLLHELAHLKRCDHLVRWLELVVGALYWWYPLLAWFKQQLREHEEAACDLWVVSLQQDRKAYAMALVEMVDYLNDSDLAVPAPACGAGPVKQLQRRLTMIMRSKWSARLSRWGLATILGIGVLAFSFGPGMTSDAIGQDGPKEKKERDGDRERGPRDGDREKGPRDGDQEKGDRPRDGDRRGGPREGFRPKDGFKGPKEGFPKGRPEGARDEGRPSREGDLEGAREELRKAREEAQKANERMRAAAEKVSRLEGRESRDRAEKREAGPQPREAGRGGAPGRERLGEGRPEGPPRGDARPALPGRPGFGFGPGDPFARTQRPGEPGRPAVPAKEKAPEASGEIREMKKQIDELRHLLMELRKDMKDERKK